jgi:hypothetical protein
MESSQLENCNRLFGRKVFFSEPPLAVDFEVLKQWNIFVKLKSSLRKCYRRHHDLVDSNGLFVLQWPQICFICRKYFPVLSAITIYYRVCNYINTTSATSGSWSTDPSGAPEFTPVFSGISVTWPFVLYVCFVGRCFSYCTFSFGHCVVCYSIYGFWLHIWYLQTLLSKVTWLELIITKKYFTLL